MIITIISATVVLFTGLFFYTANKFKHIHIQKTVSIKADIESVFHQVLYLKNFPKWSPFLEADPTQNISIKGKDGQVGAQYHWEGNGGKDLGYQEIKKVDDLKYIKMECDIQKPFQAHPTFEYSFKQVGEATTVVQDFHLQSGLIDAFFIGLFGAQKNMDKFNARGMDLLKEASEKYQQSFLKKAV